MTSFLRYEKEIEQELILESQVTSISIEIRLWAGRPGFISWQG